MSQIPNGGKLAAEKWGDNAHRTLNTVSIKAPIINSGGGARVIPMRGNDFATVCRNTPNSAFNHAMHADNGD